MNTFFVGNHPVGHYVQRFPSPQPTQTPATTNPSTQAAPSKQELAQSETMIDGEKTFFMKARIMAGQADLAAAKENGVDIEDFKWLSKDEIESQVAPEYWVRVKNMLVAQ